MSRLSKRVRACGAVGVIALVAAGVVLVTSGGPGVPRTIGPAAAVAAGAVPRWSHPVTITREFPIAVHTAPDGRTMLLADGLDGWTLRRDDGHGRFRLVASGPAKLADGDFGLDAHGHAIVAIHDTDGIVASIGAHRSYVTHGPILLSRLKGNVADPPAIVVEPDGYAVLTWTAGTRDLADWVAVRRPGQTRFGPPQRLGATTRFATILADGRDRATVIWPDETGTAGGGLNAAVLGADGRIATRAKLVTDPSIQDYAAAEGAGRVVVTWSGQHGRVRAIDRRAGTRSFARPVSLYAPEGPLPATLAVAVGDRGAATIMFLDNTGAVGVLHWAPGTRPQAPHAIRGLARVWPRLYPTRGGPTLLAHAETGSADQWLAATRSGLARLTGTQLATAVFAPTPSGLVGVWSTDAGTRLSTLRLP